MEPPSPSSLHPMWSGIIAFIVIKPISIQRSEALNQIQLSDARHLTWNKLSPGKHIQDSTCANDLSVAMPDFTFLPTSHLDLGFPCPLWGEL